ncbi:hypothetical protein HFO28_02325 [Rhizobium leguminosarum]|uniref:primase-helicase family protein n=1 Tax=Rhizobium leguminosarum TaxID=384 RepID=UPI001C954D88|nr:primase-helicase family protein [Rhizobium leguminosarum]MBY5742442.1 hypothetical protein [Rhizobium leguminosarum]
MTNTMIDLPGVTPAKPESREKKIGDLLARSFAHCPSRSRPIIPIPPQNLSEGYTDRGFKAFLQNRFQIDSGIAGQLYQMWLMHPAPLVREVELRPDKPLHYFQDERGAFVNMYMPPRHVAGNGDVEIFLRFIQHLIPGLQERTWFLRWLAYKFQHPAERMVAILFVAHAEFGTGRGTLFKLLGRLFGDAYVRTIPYRIFTGESSQGQFVNWAAESLIVCIGELAARDGAGKYAANRETYERVKDIVDTTADTMEIVAKGIPSAKRRVFFSTILATNNKDAMALPADDRRFTVISNGERMSEALRRDVNAMIADPSAVGGIAEYLATMNVSGFDPFVPIQTDIKDEMVETHVTPLEQIVEDVLSGLKGACFIPQQIECLLSGKISPQLQTGIPNVVRSLSHRVKGGNDRLEIGGRKYTVFAKSKQAAAVWREKANALIIQEVLLNGPLSPVVPLFPQLPGSSAPL